MTAARLLPLVLAALLGLAAPAAAAEPRASLPDIEDEVMCVECGTALNVSEAASADRQRAFIRRRIAEGMTKAQIKDALVAEYGRNVLADPPRRGFSATVYLVPILLALLAAAGIAVAARRWRRRAAAAPAAAPAGPALDDAAAARLERDMAAYDL